MLISDYSLLKKNITVSITKLNHTHQYRSCIVNVQFLTVITSRTLHHAGIKHLNDFSLLLLMYILLMLKNNARTEYER